MSARRLAVLVALAVAAAGGAALASRPLLAARGPAAGAGPAPVAAPVFPAIQDLQMTLVESGDDTRGPAQEVLITYRAPDLYRFSYVTPGRGGQLQIQRGSVAEGFFGYGDGTVQPYTRAAEVYCGAQGVYRLSFLEHLTTDFFVLKRDALAAGARYLLAPRSLAGMRFAGAANAELRLWLDSAGKPSRLESADGAGKLLHKYEFRNVRWNLGVADDAFQPSPPPGTRVVVPSPALSVEGTRVAQPASPVQTVRTVGSLAEARTLLPFKVFEPSRLPAGYRGPVMVRVGFPVSQFVESVYADGVGCRVTFSQFPTNRRGFSSFQGDAIRLPDGTAANRVASSVGTSLGWEREGTSLSLRGPLPLEELAATAVSLR